MQIERASIKIGLSLLKEEIRKKREREEEKK
jgi:hypothetical protein